MNKNNIILESCIKFLKSKEAKKEIKELLKPVVQCLFNEFSIYLYFFIFFIFTSFLLQIGVLLLLIKYNKNIRISNTNII
jgi:hypothetical protein